MKASVLREFKQPLKWGDVETPVPAPDEILVQVMACGIDGTDLKLLDGFGYNPDLPFIMGHEVAGIVADVGNQVKRFAPGDRVIAYNFTTCGECLLCLTHRENLCLNMSSVLGARGRNGGYGEYCVVPERQLVSLPNGISWPDAAVCCDAGVTTLHAVDRSRLQLGENVVVIGTGGVGSMALQLSKMTGARVIAVNRSERRERWSRENGADEVLDSSRVNIPNAVHDLTGGLGADCVIDNVGNKETMTYGVDSLRHGGRLVIVGYTPEEYPLGGKGFAQNELEIIGSRCGRKQDLVDTVRLVAQGRIRSIVTDTFALEEANEALDHLRTGKAMGRIVLLTPSGRQRVRRQPSR